MVQIEGKYQLVENKNLPEFLKGIGFDDSTAKAYIEGKETLEVKIDGNKIALNSDGPRGNQCLVLGEQFEETLANDVVVLAVAALQDDVLKVTSKTKDGHSGGSKIYTFTDNGLELEVTVPKGGKTWSTTRIFKRV